MDWSTAFAATLAIELPLVWASSPAPLRRPALSDGSLANLASHPVAWWLVAGSHAGWWTVEVGVVVVEAGVFAGVTGMGPWRAIGVSLLANGVSASVGFLLS